MISDKDKKFQNEIKNLNEELVDFLMKALSKSSYYNFTPTLEDYIKQFKDLEKDYNDQNGFSDPPPSSVKPDTTNPMPSLFSNLTPSKPVMIEVAEGKPFVFGSMNSSTTTTTPAPAAPLFSFSTPKTDNKLTTTTPLFSAPKVEAKPAAPLFSTSIFSMPNQAPASTTTTTAATPLFSIPKPTTTTTTTTTTINPTSQEEHKEEDDDAGAGAEGGDDEAPPPEPQIDVYEEPNVKFQVNCKLYGYQTVDQEKQLSLLGIGVLYLKDMDTPKKLQMIFRLEPELKKVLLNEVMTPNVPVKLMVSNKAVQICVVGADKTSKMYIFKCKEKDVQNLYKVLKFESV